MSSIAPAVWYRLESAVRSVLSLRLGLFAASALGIKLDPEAAAEIDTSSRMSPASSSSSAVPVITGMVMLASEGAAVTVRPLVSGGAAFDGTARLLLKEDLGDKGGYDTPRPGEAGLL